MLYWVSYSFHLISFSPSTSFNTWFTLHKNINATISKSLLSYSLYKGISQLKRNHEALIYRFHMTGNTDMYLLVTGTLKKGRGLDQKTCQYLVWPPFALCTSPSHRVDQAVDCGLWNLVPLLFNGCKKLLDIGWNWNTLSYTSIQSIPNLLNGWHVWGVCRPWKKWDIFSFKELCTCDMGPFIICWNMRWWRQRNGTTMGLRISSQYLCAFKLTSIKCNCVRFP